jgi:hypothetical protein
VPAAERREQVLAWQEAGQASLEPVQQPCATLMSSCEPGGVVGSEAAAFPTDHVDFERCCKGPTGHARRLHGPRHAGVRMVRQGPTLMVAREAHGHHEEPLTVDALLP